MKNEIKYNVDNQICQMPLQLSLLTIYVPFCVYVVPISLIMLIYVKLILFSEGKGFITEKVAKKFLKFVYPSQSENSFDFCQHA